MNEPTLRGRSALFLGFALSFAAVLLAVQTSHAAQVTGTYSTQAPAVPGAKNDPFGEDRAALDQKLEHSRERARELDRQKRMVDDANRLLALAVQYRTQVQEHGSATPEDERILAEMEKLARSVKDRMRGM